MKLQIDPNGRITLPKIIREEMGVDNEDYVEISTNGNGIATLTPYDKPYIDMTKILKRIVDNADENIKPMLQCHANVILKIMEAGQECVEKNKIDVLELSNRAYKRLERNGINTVDKLQTIVKEKNWHENYWCIGVTLKAEVEEKLRKWEGR